DTYPWIHHARAVSQPRPGASDRSYTEVGWPRTLTKVLVVAWVALTAWSTGAEDETDNGRSAAGQIKAEVRFVPPLGLPVSVFPGFPGYATGEVGFHSTLLDDPTNDFFQVSTAA